MTDVSPARAGTRVLDVTVRGQRVRVAVDDGESGRTPLLLMNGIGARLELLQPFVDRLDPGRPVVRFDVPGVGGSPAPRSPYRLWMLARTVADMLDEIAVAGPVDVLGISWGGGLAQQFAFTRQRRVRRLVLVATSPGALSVPGSPWVLRHMVSRRRYTDPDYLTRIAGTIYGGTARDDRTVGEIMGSHRSPAGHRGYLMQLLGAAGWTSVPFLPRIKAPTLVLTGDDDPIIPRINGRLMSSLLPDARLHVYEGGHLALVTEAEVLAPVVEEFLDAQPAGSVA